MAAGLAALTGLFAGGAHVVTGPDHLAAVLPLAAGSRSRAAKIGASWGVGHGLGVLVLGALGRWLADVVDIEALGVFSELVVGALLIGLGVWTLRRSRLLVVHAHAHDHEHDEGHRHVHVHIGDRTVGRPEHASEGEHHGHRHGAFGFGVLHGAAGAGHLFGVLPSLALPAGLAAAYLATYFVGAVVAMTLFALSVGALTSSPRHLPRVLGASGALSVLVGVAWMGITLAG